MRTLLFVQTGGARPKRFKDFSAHRQDPDWLAYAKDYASGVDCDRWWLAECENAEAGRRVIEVWIKYGHSCDPARFAHTSGRILASGGKR